MMKLVNKGWDRLSIRQQRYIEGCYYLGCFTPVAFTVLAGLIIAKSVQDYAARIFVKQP